MNERKHFCSHAKDAGDNDLVQQTTFEKCWLPYNYWLNKRVIWSFALVWSKPTRTP
jgi:hypothetical protein